MRQCRKHPRDQHQIVWRTDSDKISYIVGATCGKCGAALNVSTPRGDYVSGPRRLGQDGPPVSGRPRINGVEV